MKKVAYWGTGAIGFRLMVSAEKLLMPAMEKLSFPWGYVVTVVHNITVSK